MSLGVIFKSPEGLVLAADSRVTVMAQQVLPPVLTPPSPGQVPSQMIQLLPAYFDNATKLLNVNGHPYVGIVTYGAGAIGITEPRTAHGYLPEFEKHLTTLGENRLTVERFAEEVSSFYTRQWTDSGMPPAPLPQNIQPMIFLVAGFDENDAYGKIFQIDIPNAPSPVEQKAGTFGIVWGGQFDFLERLLNGIAPEVPAIAQATLGLDDVQTAELRKQLGEQLALPIPYQFLPLQDCIDMATFLVSMTSEVQTWMVSVRGVGGAIDVATITRTDGFNAISRKRNHAWGDV